MARSPLVDGFGQHEYIDVTAPILRRAYPGRWDECLGKGAVAQMQRRMAYSERYREGGTPMIWRNWVEK